LVPIWYAGTLVALPANLTLATKPVLRLARPFGNCFDIKGHLVVFSSPEFLFLFMPAFFAIYFILPQAWRNGFIVIGSLLFYVLSGGYIVAVLLFSILMNYTIALRIARSMMQKNILLALGIICNLAPLLYYKYWPFIIRSFDDGATLIGGHALFDIPKFFLPVGISFYTFHGISYLIDVYKKKVAPASSLVDFAMYMVNFPQLIAGPIVRYVEIVNSINDRPVRDEQIFRGIVRFMFGLGKKLILADTIGSISDRIFALPQSELTTSLAWLGTIAYTLQIYYDFSGYSDMAIGLGRIMGFEFPENFNQPYRSQSVTEFWRRWHMTLTRWFRDYVYLSLGGNREGPIRTYMNLFVVFCLCGLWHGAAYTFIVWGLYHGILLVIERIARNRFGVSPAGFSGQALTILLVMVGWVFFRAGNFDLAIGHLATMFFFHMDRVSIFNPEFYLTDDKIAFILAGAFFALFPFEQFDSIKIGNRVAIGAEIVAVMLLLVYTSALVAANGFNPFIYFRF
jgi:alginate O-acetyltransferase complex protein AlgI